MLRCSREPKDYPWSSGTNHLWVALLGTSLWTGTVFFLFEPGDKRILPAIAAIATASIVLAVSRFLSR